MDSPDAPAPRYRITRRYAASPSPHVTTTGEQAIRNWMAPGLGIGLYDDAALNAYFASAQPGAAFTARDDEQASVTIERVS